MKMMKTRLLKAIIGFGGMVFLVGCQGMKEDIEQLQEPIPTGVVILKSEIHVQNGASVQIPFRVNPSNYVPTKEHVSLDVIESQITRVAYGTSIPEYVLTDTKREIKSLYCCI